MMKNTYKENTYKEEETIASPKRRSSLKLLRDRRFQLVWGFFLLFSSVYLLIAFISYLFTAQIDQSLVEAFDSTGIQEAGDEVENWLGMYGALVAYYFIYKWFGLGAFLLIPILFAYAWFWILRNKLMTVGRFTQFTFFTTVLLSVLLGYIFSTLPEENYLGLLVGSLGYEIALFLKALLGWGAILFIVFSLLVFVIYIFNVTSIQSPNTNWKSSLKEKLQTIVDDSATQVEETPFTNGNEAGTTVAEEDPIVTHPLDTDDLSKLDEELEKMGIKLIDAKTKKEIKPQRIREEKRKAEEEIPEEALEESEWQPTTDIEEVKRKVEATAEEIELDVEEKEEETPVAKKTTAEEVAFSIHTEEAEAPTEEVEEEEKTTEQVLNTVNYDPTLDLQSYQFPPLTLLNEPGQDKVQVSREELEANKDKIVQTLGHYGIKISSIKATIGPTVTLYEIIPDAGIRISKIKNLEDDIALRLAALGNSIIETIPGKGNIGIEEPNKKREIVMMRPVLATEKFMKSKMQLPVVFGKTVTNDIFITDLAKMPHLLMAGATGQGKSVGLNVILTSLVYRKHPSELKFVLVDPKKVELTLFSKIERHFLAKLPNEEEAIITDTSKVINTLNSLCIEMDNRYDLLKNAACRNIKEYNQKFKERKLNPEKGHRFLPYIVLVIDELADLMMTAGKEVEQPIARLAQLARAIGIHLVVATQRPSVNVITGIIKANFPARLSFRVTSKIDSRTILDTGGAEQLIGMGDMLYSTGSDLTRLQCAFVDTPEVERICDFIGEQRGYPEAYQLPEYVGEEASKPGEVDLADRDTLFEEAARIIVMHQQGSTSLLQRRLKLGYNRAGRLIDQLEQAGIVGPFEGSKAREVLIPDEYMLEELLKSLD
ncbi:MAG: DNA translocase FtsK 4TM domain-containing protein [Thermonemataceae bacterium]